MKLAITGANGLIGSALVRAAEAEGHAVTALVRPGADLSRLGGHRPTVTDYGDGLQALLAGHDALVHTAWGTTGAYRDDPANDALADLTAQVAEAAARADLSTLVGVGTCLEVHDDGSRYAASKRRAHQHLVRLTQASGQRLAWARVFGVVGPGEHPSRLNSRLLATLSAGEVFEATAGTAVRDWTYTDDVATGLLALATHDLHGAHDLATGQGHTVAHFFSSVAARLDRTHFLRLGARPTPSGEPPRIVGQPTALRGTGWSPRPLDLALDDLVAAWRSSPWA